jgi:hypothetical protein
MDRTLALSDDGEVVTEDTQLWQQIAAAPLQYSSGWCAGVLPTELPAFTKKIDLAGAIWQIGAADGRFRMLDDTVPKPVLDRQNLNADFLMQRIKQQLDPSNTFRPLEVPA